jgi:hypothetical protein
MEECSINLNKARSLNFCNILYFEALYFSLPSLEMNLAMTEHFEKKYISIPE